MNDNTRHSGAQGIHDVGAGGNCRNQDCWFNSDAAHYAAIERGDDVYGFVPEEPPRPAIRRINVAVNPDMVAAIQHVMDQEDVDLTEAVRRLIGYGDFVYRQVKDKGNDVLVRDDLGTQEVVLVR